MVAVVSSLLLSSTTETCGGELSCPSGYNSPQFSFSAKHLSMVLLHGMWSLCHEFHESMEGQFLVVCKRLTAVFPEHPWKTYIEVSEEGRIF